MLDQSSLATLESYGVRYLWHFTSIDNWPGIFTGGLLPRARLANDAFSDIAYEDAVQLRSGIQIPCRLCQTNHRGHEVVPLFLAYKNPMTFRRKSVPRTCLLQINIASLLSHGAHLAFTDGNLASIHRTRVFTNADDLNQVDWQILVADYWGPLGELTDAENRERKRRRAAEFLVYPAVPAEGISRIVVRTQADFEYLKQRTRQHPGTRERHKEIGRPLRVKGSLKHFYE